MAKELEQSPNSSLGTTQSSCGSQPLPYLEPAYNGSFPYGMSLKWRISANPSVGSTSKPEVPQNSGQWDWGYAFLVSTQVVRYTDLVQRDPQVPYEACCLCA